ncbi:MAG: proteasome assembly chaperone family protein [Halobacteriales archaeon]
MADDAPDVTFDRLTELGTTEPPTLVEGLPGHGMVASIAVDQITRQLDLEHHGNIVSDAFPPVASFTDGRVRDPVRVYAGDPGIMTLQADIPLPQSAFEALSACVLRDLAAEFERAIFLAGAPAQAESEIGAVRGVATSDDMEADLEAAGIQLAEGTGVVGGITGAMVAGCHHADLPAAVLIVKAHPYVPDPAAARSVIEEALEPLVEFDIDTTELAEQAEDIQAQLEQIAQQYQQMSQQPEAAAQPTGPSMYQ